MLKVLRTCFNAVVLFFAIGASAQSNILSTDSMAGKVMLGQYDPAAYTATTILNHPDTISRGILANVSADSIHAYIEDLRKFHTRNTGSDTMSSTNGIGAARRWGFSKFQQFSAQNQNRLIPSYLQFDYGICSINQHRNTFAVLPGLDTSDKSIILIEGHLDSRCEGLCDTACLAQGIEDNASGCALVLELARVMSRYSYNHTIVFMLTIAEEQGLTGAQAFANYLHQKGIQVKAVFNNDVVGGIFCGHTSSPPSCSGYGNIDSTNVRIFSDGVSHSYHKGLARYTKLEYKEMIMPYTTVPMNINIMTEIDRTGRGGDHIPFTSWGYTSIRLTAANEDGDANSSSTSYVDRQHSYRDTLGVDINTDGIIDSFFVDFNYISRNTVINGNAAGMAAISPRIPTFSLSGNGVNNLIVDITQQTQYPAYRVGVRSTTNDWDTVYTFTGTLHCVMNNIMPNLYEVSVASVDNDGVESFFTNEQEEGVAIGKVGVGVPHIELLQNKPNPADESTAIAVFAENLRGYQEATISIRDISGREVKRVSLMLQNGMNEVIYNHGFHASGMYVYTLLIDGKAVQSKQMVFSN